MFAFYSTLNESLFQAKFTNEEQASLKNFIPNDHKSDTVYHTTIFEEGRGIDSCVSIFHLVIDITENVMQKV